jgi:hypothetical protein
VVDDAARPQVSVERNLDDLLALAGELLCED